jgi:chemotaxis protein MotA
MDFGTIFGVAFAVGAILWAMYEGTHGHLDAFYSTEGFVLVMGGSLAAVCLSMPLRSVLNVFGYLKNWIFAREAPVHETIRKLVGFAEMARRDGMLSLEKIVADQTDPFLRKGLQLAVDGCDTDMVEEALQIEIDALGERHKQGKKFFELMGKYGPGFGLTATLIGQIAMFRNLGGDSSAIGKALAIALIGTLYGCLISNVVCGPIADKLAIRSSEERMVREMILVGLRSIQAGDNPRIVELKLQSFLSDRERRRMNAAAQQAKGKG